MQDAGWDCHVHVFDAAAPAAAGAHYRPVARPLREIEALAAAHGCGHLVLVQPSVYGTDNALLLRSLAASDGRHRGVVVVAAGIAMRELQAMHAVGVRGVRFNLVSPVGSALADTGHQLRELAPLLAALGWHAQWYVHPGLLPQLAHWQAGTGLVFVLDHLAGITPATNDTATWDALAALAAAGAWIKLSGWYRLQAQPPYEALDAQLRRVAALFGEHALWASDWPHTSFAPDALPAYASLWAPVPRALGAGHAQRVLRAGALLYA